MKLNTMKKTNIRKLYYHVRYRYFTMNNVVVGIALIIGMGWAWASVGVMQRNYALQKEVDDKKRQQTLIELENANLAYQQNYYKSAEYQELAVRERMGFADPGEKVIVLPPNSAEAKNADATVSDKKSAATVEPMGNFQQWMNFLFGANKER